MESDIMPVCVFVHINRIAPASGAPTEMSLLEIRLHSSCKARLSSYMQHLGLRRVSCCRSPSISSVSVGHGLVLSHKGWKEDRLMASKSQNSLPPQVRLFRVAKGLSGRRSKPPSARLTLRLFRTRSPRMLSSRVARSVRSICIDDGTPTSTACDTSAPATALLPCRPALLSLLDTKTPWWHTSFNRS